MSMKAVRYKVEAVLLWLLFSLFGALPVDAASAAGGFIARSIGPHLAASRKARRHIEAALPDKTPQQIAEIIRGMWDNLGRVLAEYPHLDYIAQNRLTVTGVEHIQQALEQSQDQGKGAVFFSIHMGNWEVPPIYLKTVHKAPVYSLYRAPNNPAVDAMIAARRTLKGRIPAFAKSRAGGQGALKSLREGGFMAILIDQKYNEGVNVPFFGMEAMTNPFFVKAARKFDVPLHPAFLRRTRGVHFELSVHAPMDLHDQSDEAIIAQAHALIEAEIATTPAQWIWMHRRWR